MEECDTVAFEKANQRSLDALLLDETVLLKESTKILLIENLNLYVGIELAQTADLLILFGDELLV